MRGLNYRIHLDGILAPTLHQTRYPLFHSFHNSGYTSDTTKLGLLNINTMQTYFIPNKLEKNSIFFLTLFNF